MAGPTSRLVLLVAASGTALTLGWTEITLAFFGGDVHRRRVVWQNDAQCPLPDPARPCAGWSAVG